MKQMVGIHGLFDQGWHMPLAFGLLPGKTEALYIDLFSALYINNIVYSKLLIKIIVLSLYIKIRKKVE